MDYLIKKSHLKGDISIPRSKSFSHRHLIMAMLSQKQTQIEHVNLCDDIDATLNVAKALGARVGIQKDCVSIDSTSLWNKEVMPMDIHASGSTLRFMIPICLTHEGKYTFYLRDRLKERSLKVYEQVLKNCTFTRKGERLEVEGKLLPGYYEVDGSHSSQFLSGLCMAFPLLEGDSELVIKGTFVSKDYFLMTLDCMKKAGVQIETVNESHYKIKGQQPYCYVPYAIECDASSAAFIKVANYLGQEIEGVKLPTSYQSDAMIDTFIHQIKQGSCVVDVKDCPDVVPSLALAMSLSPYEYEIIHASRLKDKESNRLEATADVLNTLGAKVQVLEDGLKIQGVPSLHGGQIDSYQDHRIAMMATIAGLVADGDVVIKNGECVSKSWPTFYKQLQEIGGVIDELPLRK